MFDSLMKTVEEAIEAERQNTKNARAEADIWRNMCAALHAQMAKPEPRYYLKEQDTRFRSKRTWYGIYDRTLSQPDDCTLAASAATRELADKILAMLNGG